MSGTKWILRNPYLPPENGWYGSSNPNDPADYRYLWGEAKWDDKLEQVIFADFKVRTVIGGTDKSPDDCL